jgi:Tol biopolymer transport system component
MMKASFSAVFITMILVLTLAACDKRMTTLPAGLTYVETEVEFAYIDWAPDSSRLVGSSPDLGHPSPLGFLERQTSSEVYIWDPGTDSYRQVSDESPTMHNVKPVWQPGGDLILYYSEDEFNGRRGAGIVGVNSLSRRTVANLGTSMDWLPDGTRLAINNGGSVYTIGVEGGKPTKLWGAPRGQLVVDLAVSPRGNEYAVVTRAVGESVYRIVAVTMEGGVERELFRSDVQTRSISWSPDGRWLLFLQVVKPGEIRPFAIRSDGSCVTEAWYPEIDAKFGDISWSPDGARIAAALFLTRNSYGVLFAEIDSASVQDWLTSGSCGDVE